MQGIHARGGYVLNIFWKNGKLTKVEINGKKEDEIILQYKEIKKNIVFICDKMILDGNLNMVSDE